MYTFKAQDKSNAKRFLTKTCGVEQAQLDNYLTQNADGAWGCYIDADKQPVPFAYATATSNTQADAAHDYSGQPEPADVQEPLLPAENPLPAGEPADEPPPVPSAFGMFALTQLTASSNAAPAPAPATARPARENATPTAGLRIQKDRPMQNGIKRQSAGSVGDKLWAIYDRLGAGVTLEQAKAEAAAVGLSPTSAAIALYNWRKFNGVPSRPIAKG